MAKIRWRLIVGLVSLGVTVILTIPAPGTAGPLNSRVAGIWNGLGPVADIIWPNGPADIIWPNDPTVDIIWPNADSPVGP